MNIDQIKKEFPIFDNKVQNNDLVYLDSANSSQKPRIVIDRIYDFYSKEFSNVGRSVHYLAVAATNLYEQTRTSVQKYINASDKNEIVFTKGATEAINLVANTFGQKHLKEGDEVLITELEHHSNYVPWHYLRKTKGVKIEFADVILISKSDLVTGDEVSRSEAVINSLNPDARVIATDNGDVDLDAVIDTGRFDFEKAQRAFVRSQTSQGLQVSPRNPFPAAANRQPLAAK